MYNKAKPILEINNTKRGVNYTMGPISIHQFNEFSKFGINALRLFQYVMTVRGLKKLKKDDFVKIDNANLYSWFGVHQPKKWTVLNKLHNAGLIELRKQGKGKAPLVKIIVPTKH